MSSMLVVAEGFWAAFLMDVLH